MYAYVYVYGYVCMYLSVTCFFNQMSSDFMAIICVNNQCCVP